MVDRVLGLKKTGAIAQGLSMLSLLITLLSDYSPAAQHQIMIVENRRLTRCHDLSLF